MLKAKRLRSFILIRAAVLLFDGLINLYFFTRINWPSTHSLEQGCFLGGDPHGRAIRQVALMRVASGRSEQKRLCLNGHSRFFHTFSTACISLAFNSSRWVSPVR